MDSDWARLPKNILDLILKKLVSPWDYARFSIICASWHCRAKEKRTQRAKMSNNSPPMMLISAGENGIWQLYDAMNNKVFDVELQLRNKRFCGSSKGWLIVVEENFTVTLINPFLRIKGREKENSIIHLPPLTLPYYTNEERWAPKCDYFVYRAAISSDPILNADNCVVAVIYLEMRQLAFIRLGKDTTWTYVDQKYTLVCEVIFVQDRIYAVDAGTKLLFFDITTGTGSGDHAIVNEVTRKLEPLAAVSKYLVALNEREFWLVQRYMHYDFAANKRVTKKFKVFELDSDSCKWVAKNTLGDIALFVGDNSSVFVLASEFPGCKPNCIYFNHDRDLISNSIGPSGPCAPHDYGVYNVETRSFSQPYSTDATTLVKKAAQRPMWVMPTIQL